MHPHHQPHIELILQHLTEKGPITSLDALERYGCFRLAARINELRNQGYDIETKARLLENGKTVAVYHLKSLAPIN